MTRNIDPFKPNPTLRRIGVGLVISILAAGCASNPAPTEQMAVSRAAVNNAMSAGGNEFAPTQLKSAVAKMEAAERAMEEKNYELAQQLSEQAEVDAKLAGEMARSAKAQKAADTVQEDVRVLRQEIDRKAQ